MPEPIAITGISNQTPARLPHLPRIDRVGIPTASTLYGREAELGILARWILEEHCRVVSVLGMGGIGKSALAVSLMHQLADHFEVMIWRSLRDAPPFEAFLDDCLRRSRLSRWGSCRPIWKGASICCWNTWLAGAHSLVFDNLEILLEEGVDTGRLCPGFEGYGKLLQRWPRASTRAVSCSPAGRNPVISSKEGTWTRCAPCVWPGWRSSACKEFTG